MPIDSRSRADDLIGDGTQHGGDALGPEADKSAGKQPFSAVAGAPPRRGIQVVHRVGTQIDEEAAGLLKDAQEIAVVDSMVECLKRVTHGAIQAGIAGIEEAAGGWRGLSDEQEANPIGPKGFPQGFPFAMGQQFHSLWA